MGAFNNLMDGFLLAGTPEGLLYCLIGVTIGTMVGVLPGLGPVGAMALLFPISLKVGPMYGIIMLTGIYFGAMYGGSTTSILINVPGEACSVVTCIDGNQMAKKGRAGAALAVCAIGSWVAGTAGIVLITLFAPPLARIALTLGPQEFFSIMLFGLIVLSSATGGSPLKSLLAVLLGMMFGTVGLDVLTGANRFTFGFFQLSKGIQTVSLVMGLFGFSEVLSALIKPYDIKDAIKVRFKDLYPKKEELKRSVMPIIRGTLCGLPIGLLPGSSTLVATLLSYRTEKFFAKDPSRFGKGAIEGVAGPESANNAAATAGMIPLLALGLPFSPITAILMGAFMVHGVIPGPFLITQHSGLFWAVVASFYIGNVMLLILNFPLVGIFASLTKVRCSILMPIVAGMVIIGVYALDSNSFDLWIALIFGILAYIMKELVDFPLVPIIIGYILGPMVEKSFRQAMVLSEGSLFAIMQRPISAVFLSAAFLILVIGLVRYFLRITKGNAMVSENSEL